MLEKGQDAGRQSFLCGICTIIVAGWLGLSACSSLHEVTVVGHGAQTSEPSPVPDSTDISAPVPTPMQTPAVHHEPAERLSSPPPNSLSEQSTMEEVSTDIMAQSSEEPSLPRTLEDVFFEFDQYLIRPEGIKTLEVNAKVLKERYPDRELILQGHCDERGTEEYNLILGERRAAAVKNFLKDLGVSPANLRVLSLGKMQPFCLSQTVECFRKNRRVHFVFE